jgi:hypothetical protein
MTRIALAVGGDTHESLANLIDESVMLDGPASAGSRGCLVQDEWDAD